MNRSQVIVYRFPPIYRVIFCYMAMLAAACNSIPDKEKQLAAAMGEPVGEVYINTLDTTHIDKAIAIADSVRLAGNHYKAKQLFWEAARNAKAINYPLGLTASMAKLIYIYNVEQQYDSALLYYRLIMPYAQALPKEYCYPELLHMLISWGYDQRGNTDSALVYSYRSMRTIDTHYVSPSAYKNAFLIFQTSGAIWFNNGQENIALPYLIKAASFAAKTKDSSLLATCTSMKASVLFRMQQTDSALALFNEVLANKHTPPEQLVQTHYNLGTMYVLKDALDQPQKAVYHFNEALKLSRRIYGANSAKEIIYLYGLATAYLNYGTKENREPEIRKAISIFKSIHAKKEKENLAENATHFYNNFAGAYSSIEDYKNAYETIQKSVAVRDSLYKKEKLEIVGKLEVQYRVAEKDKQLAEQQLKIAQQKTWIIGIVAGVLLLLILTATLLKRKKHQQETARLKAMLTGAEQERKRLARELHDGILSKLSAIKLKFSTLTNKDAAQADTGFQETLLQLEQSINELRTTSHNLYPEILEQEGLANATRIFCKKITNITGIDIEFQMIGMLPALANDFQLEVYRMIQELVQNIIKHANATHALVQISAREDWVSITIDDNGKGMNKEQLANRDGIGLTQLKKRVQAMNGNFDIESDNGTSIYIEFDLKHLQHEH